MRSRHLENTSETHSAYAVLLAGGVGTRLWPVSRELYPKQLAKFIGEDSLVQTTIKRLGPALASERVRIVCGQEHYHELKRHMEEIGISPEGKLFCEPCGRNTAAAVLLAVFHILEIDADAELCVFPADHVIRDIDNFHSKIRSALTLAAQGNIVTFGIKPHYPETGYGYIEGTGSAGEGALHIKRFVEKPDKKTAQSYLSAGNFFWNSGMFAFKASVIRDEFQSLSPEIFQKMLDMFQNRAVTLDAYQALPDISFDYAIMEKTEKGVVLPSDFGWSDIGSWKSLYDFLEKDDNKNVMEGDVISKDTEGCFILGHERLIATNSIQDLVVVETPDSVFVSDLDTSRDVKAIVATLKSQGRKEFKTHRTVYHPWGHTTLLEEHTAYAVHRIMIYPGETCRHGSDKAATIQLTAVRGRAEVSVDNRSRLLKSGESIPLPGASVAEIKNNDESSLVLVSVESNPEN